MVLLALLIALIWPAMWAGSRGTVDVLLGAGEEGPSRQMIEDDIPDLAPLESVGHDGQQFYVISQHPFDPEAGADHLDTPAYRYRRILYPMLGGMLAPGGGRAVIGSFFLLSMVGVLLAALALRALPGGPRWLPVVAAVSPTVITSLTLSLSDAFGAGLGMAALSLATRRRWGWAVLCAVLAALTRETFLIVALGLVLAPGMPIRWRATSLVAPCLAVGGWLAWLGRQLSTSLLEGGSDQLAPPLTGYLAGDTDGQTFLVAALAVVLLVLGAWRCSRIAPHIAAVLVLQAILLVCVSELVAFNWVNCVRTAAPMLPLAVWALVAKTTDPDTDDGAHAAIGADPAAPGGEPPLAGEL